MAIPVVTPSASTSGAFREEQWDKLKDNINHMIDRGADLVSAAALPLPTHRLHKVTGSVSITSIAAGGRNGQVVTLVFTGAPLVVTGNNLSLFSSYQAAANETLTLVCYSGTWYEVGRSLRTGSLDLPWEVYIWPYLGAKANVNWSTIGISTSQLMNATYNSSGAQNDEIEFDVVLGAGTWTLELLHYAFTDRGIFTAYLDGVSVGTLDGYSASEVRHKRQSITGIVVATPGKKTFKLKMATKNASASSYAAALMLATWRRTA